MEEIGGVAVTVGPGMISCLDVGLEYARELAKKAELVVNGLNLVSLSKSVCYVKFSNSVLNNLHAHSYTYKYCIYYNMCISGWWGMFYSKIYVMSVILCYPSEVELPGYSAD